MPTEYIETFEFKLNADGSKSELLKGFQQSNQWLEQKPEFIYRSIAFNEDNNSWQDVLYWRSAKAAQQAAKEFLQEPLNQLFIQQIDPDSVATQKHQVLGEFYTNSSCE